MSHPIEGVWAVETKYDDRPRTDRGTILFHPEGTVSIAFSEYAAHAVWQTTGEGKVAVTGTRPVGPNEGFIGWFTLKGLGEVSDDGVTLSMKALQTRPRPDGSMVEQRATITGTRVLVAS
ncbi:MAG: hypothetical protein ACC726_05425 [Chloroflexota bacterium]